VVQLYTSIQNVSQPLTAQILTSSWSQRLLQLFGTESRPLVLIIDDCQWLEPSEVALWRHFLESSQALNHILVACAYRVEENRPPSSSMLLSTSATQMLVDRLPEDSVLDLLHACFHNRVDQAANLVSFLHAETAGSPLYLRSLISTLVSSHFLCSGKPES
jgi:predicted ATPase